MEMITPIRVEKVKRSKLNEVDFENLEVGQHLSDHMFVCDYKDHAWQEPMIVPYNNLTMAPDTLALHYGQTVFEGMKAFRMKNGSVNVFRINKHHLRFNRSLDRMCMPQVPAELFGEGLKQLIKIDAGWVPSQDGSSLYIRPFMYASEAKLGVKVSDNYKLIIFSGPVPKLFVKPIKVKIETDYIRAARGGTGFAKCGGNYGGAFYATQLAKEQGYDQVLWTSGKDNQTIEESGMMNAMFVIDGKLITPPLSDSILDGVTRNSLLTLAKDLGIQTQERAVEVEELKNAFNKQSITEAFGAGTLAVVAPIAVIAIEGKDYMLPAYDESSVLNILKRKLDFLRRGVEPDPYQWNFVI